MKNYTCSMCFNIMKTKIEFKRHIRDSHDISYANYLLYKRLEALRISQVVVEQRREIEMDIQDVDFSVE